MRLRHLAKHATAVALVIGLIAALHDLRPPLREPVALGIAALGLAVLAVLATWPRRRRHASSRLTPDRNP